MAVSKPVVPVQPKEARYGIDKLYLTQVLTREKYFEIYGEEAPFYDPSRKPKRWFFTDVLEGSVDPDNELVQFQVWDPNKRAIVPLVMTKREASLPNLTGVVKFREYKNSETTTAKMYGPTGEGGDGYSPINGAVLADPKLVDLVVKEIQKDTGVQFDVELSPDPWPWKYVYGSETRRNLNLVRESEQYSAAYILQQRFKNGLGHPGKWLIEKGVGPVFEPAVIPSGSGDSRPEVPVPVRPLLPNERIDTNPFGSVVTRTDMTQNEPAPGTGSLTVVQDKLLKQVAEDVAFIKAKLESMSG
jgi:hypothetical protein